MLPERTTTIGEGESVTTERPFHSMKAVESTRAKLSSWVRNCRGCKPFKAESIVTGLKGTKDLGELDRLMEQWEIYVISVRAIAVGLIP